MRSMLAKVFMVMHIRAADVNMIMRMAVNMLMGMDLTAVRMLVFMGMFMFVATFHLQALL